MLRLVRPERWSLLREGLRARARLHAAVLAAASLVVAAAVVGAVFAAAAQESIARSTIAAAAPGTAGLHVVAESSPDDPTYPAGQLDQVLADAPPAGRSPSFPRRIPVVSLDTEVRASSQGAPEPSRLVWREGFCAHLRIVSGRCPRRAGEAIVSRRTVLDGVGWRVGGTFTATDADELRVVGVYLPRSEDDPFWAGVDYFDGGIRSVGGGAVEVAADSVFTARQEFTDRIVSSVQMAIDYPIAPDAVVIGDGDGLRQSVAAIRRTLPPTVFSLQTGLPRVLEAALVQRGYVEQGTRLVSLQLVLLGIAVLFFVVLDLTEGRRREIALAKLRGQSGAAVARFALAEPVAVLVVALPAGVLLGWLAGAVLGALALRPGTPVLLPPAAIGSAALALLGAALASAVSTLRVLRRPVLEQWSDAERPVRRAVRVLQGAVAVLAALVAVALLALGRRGSPTAVLVPALLLVVIALAGVPLLVALARRSAPRSRASGAIARFLVMRRLARGVTVRRTATLLVATLGLAAFAVGGQSVLAANRLARAQTELGAQRVLAVAPDGGADPVLAVQQADPDGRWAMAAATWLPDGGLSVAGTVLGVDPARLGAVAVPTADGLPARTLARLLDATNEPPLHLTGDRLTATVDVADLTGDRAPDALLVVRTDAGRTVRAQAGALAPGTRRLTAAVPCDGGCTFRGFVWTRSVLAEDPASATITVRSLAVQRDGRTTALPARTTAAGAWRAAVPVSESSDRVRVTSSGVVDAFRVESGEAGIVYAATRLPVPAVVSPGGLADDPPDGGRQVVDGQGAALAFHPVRSTPLLPEVQRAGVAMDVTALDRELTGFAQSAEWQVWLSASAPADAVQRLERAGLVVGDSTTVADRTTALSREGPALAFTLLLALAIVAAGLAVLATAVSAGAAAHGRVREAAAMRLIGVPLSTVTRAAVGEQVVLLAVAALLAVPAGVVAVLLVMPLVRETATASPVPLTFVPHPLPVAVLLVVYLAAVGAVGAATARAVVRSADPRRLREVDG